MADISITINQPSISISLAATIQEVADSETACEDFNLVIKIDGVTQSTTTLVVCESHSINVNWS